MNLFCVLPVGAESGTKTCSILIGFSLPVTPTYGQNILLLVRRIINLLRDGTSLSKLKDGMVEMLVTAPAAAIVENVIFITENILLRKTAMTAEEKQKRNRR